METRSNHVLVGGVVLAILVVTLGFILWLSNLSGSSAQQFDIFFRQSVDGLNKGSTVTFSGVPVGTVKEIRLMPNRPEFVRVRITVEEDTPVLQGTTATMSGVGFTGVSQITLDGAVRGQPPITEPGPLGVPVIPTKRSGFGELLASAPQLLDRLTTLSERLSNLMDDRNQDSLANILANTDRLTAALADRAPQIDQTLATLRLTLEQGSNAADQIAQLAASTNVTVQRDVAPAMADLRRTTAAARQSMENLDAAISDARPGLQAFSKQTIPEVGLLVQDLREMSSALTAVAGRLDRGGAGGLIGGSKLPDYEGQ